MVKPYTQTDEYVLYLEDCIKVLRSLPAESVDVIFADPPYFLSNGGVTCSGGRMVSVDKGEWDKVEDKHKFNRKWLKACLRVLKPSGTVWISGTLHNIYSVGMALEQEGFEIINNITWQKTNPPPNLACKCFTHSTETILWARKKLKKKGKYTFHYEEMKALNGGKQMKDVWTGTITPQREKKLGKHPTQKPEYLLERILLASTNEGDLVLDPFCGSSTTGVVACRLGRKYIGIDSNAEYIELSLRRLQEKYE